MTETRNPLTGMAMAIVAASMATGLYGPVGPYRIDMAPDVDMADIERRMRDLGLVAVPMNRERSAEAYRQSPQAKADRQKPIIAAAEAKRARRAAKRLRDGRATP